MSEARLSTTIYLREWALRRTMQEARIVSGLICMIVVASVETAGDVSPGLQIIETPICR